MAEPQRSSTSTHGSTLLWATIITAAVVTLVLLTIPRGQKPTTCPGPLLPAGPTVLSAAQLDARFGPLPAGALDGDPDAQLAWSQRIDTLHLRGLDRVPRIDLPLPGRFRRFSGSPAVVLAHRAIEPQLEALFVAWEAAGLAPLIVEWSGSYVPRYVRGTDVPSSHAYGVSFDLNSSQNRFGAFPQCPGEAGTVVPLVPIAEAFGFAWGGRWATPDPMHFEAYRVLPPDDLARLRARDWSAYVYAGASTRLPR